MFTDLNSIYKTFQSLTSNTQKVQYLKELQSMNLPYDIHYDNLIKLYS